MAPALSRTQPRQGMLCFELSVMPDAYAEWKGWSRGDFGRHSRNDARYYAWHVQRALGARAVPWQVLEIGFGNGSFMGWVRAGGHRIVGVEANVRLVDLALQAGFEAMADVAQLDAARRFDLVAAFDVLEHVPAAQFEPLIARLIGLLADDGRVLLRFPNGESPFGLPMQHGDLTHTHALGLSKVRQLCSSCGLRLEHSGEALPWRALPPSRRPGAWLAQMARCAFEWRLRKMYSLPRGLDLWPNQLVVLSRA